MDTKIRVGIAGTGFSAQAHAEALRRIPQIEITAVAASTQEKADAFARRYGLAKAYGNTDLLIDDPEVDVIHNCTPNHLHYPINRRVLLAGKHLMSEKPLAVDSGEARELAELGRASAGVHGVCFNYRFYPMVQQMKAALAQGRYGRVHMVYGGYWQDWLSWDTDYNWRIMSDRNGPSRAMADIGSHWCDTIQYVLGQKITEVMADLRTVYPVRFIREGSVETFAATGREKGREVAVDTEDGGHVLVRFEDGTTGSFSVSQISAGRKNKLFFEIAAEQASLSWNQEEADQLWIGRRDEPNETLVRDPSLLLPEAAPWAHYPGGHQEGWPDALKNLFMDYYAAVRNRATGTDTGRAPLFAGLDDGLYVMRIVEAILESHRGKRWVPV